MKKMIILSALFLSGAFADRAAAEPTFYFDFDGDAVADTNLTISPGDIFTADIYVNDIGDYYAGIAQFGVNVFYDAVLAQVNSASVDSGWELPGAYVGPGTVELSGAMFFGSRFDDPLPAGSITFQNLGTGSFFLGMADPGPGFDSLAAYIGFDTYSYDADTANPIVYQSALVQAQDLAAVPVPGTVLLFGSGLLGLIGIRRKDS